MRSSPQRGPQRASVMRYLPAVRAVAGTRRASSASRAAWASSGGGRRPAHLAGGRGPPGPCRGAGPAAGRSSPRSSPPDAAIPARCPGARATLPATARGAARLCPGARPTEPHRFGGRPEHHHQVPVGELVQHGRAWLRDGDGGSHGATATSTPKAGWIPVAAAAVAVVNRTVPATVSRSVSASVVIPRSTARWTRAPGSAAP